MPEIDKQFESGTPKLGVIICNQSRIRRLKRLNQYFNEYQTLRISEGIRELVDNVTGAIQMVAPVFYWLVGVVGEA